MTSIVDFMSTMKQGVGRGSVTYKQLVDPAVSGTYLDNPVSSNCNQQFTSFIKIHCNNLVTYVVSWRQRLLPYKHSIHIVTFIHSAASSSSSIFGNQCVAPLAANSLHSVLSSLSVAYPQLLLPGELCAFFSDFQFSFKKHGSAQI